MRLLLTEDDEKLGKAIRTGLRHEGYAVDWVRDGEAALSAARSESYDGMILDLGLPRCPGLQVLERIRDEGQDVPILILTAKDTTQDKILGLDKGADDYMVKPFDLDELSARIRALLRRRAGRAKPLIKHKDLELDPASHTVRKAGVLVDIPTKSFVVLQILMENIGSVLSRSRLEEHLYSWKDDVESNAVEVHVHRIRKKLGADVIRTVRGVGYIID